MKFWMFHLMPWPYLPQDFAEKYDTAWVTCPNGLFDPERGPEVYRWKPPYLYNSRLKDRLFRVHVPTLIVWGSEDRLAPPALAEVFKQGITGAEVTLVPGATHALLLEQPQRVVEIVSQFLRR